MIHRVATLVLVAALVSSAAVSAAPAEDIDGNIVFARGTALLKADPRGKTETTIATLPAKAAVRALRTDAAGKILLADVGGTWSWMPLDGSTKTLTDLPCDAGPAQLGEDGLCVLCRAKEGRSIIVNLKTGKVTPVDVPAGGRIAGVGADRKLVWADKTAVWTASPADPKTKKQVAKQSPLRGFLPSPDGTHAVGVYSSELYEGKRGSKNTRPAELLMVFALDGEGARRKTIQSGVPVEWSHDGGWVLVQDRSSACIMFAAGGEYKCWRGYTAASIAPDGKYALLLGNRDKHSDKPKKKKKKGKKGKKEKEAPPEEEEASGEPVDAEHGPEDVAADEVPVELPKGPLSLYRAELSGPYALSPRLVEKLVDGAAVWIP